MTIRDATSRPVVLIDSREKLPLDFSSDVDVERCTLPTGDYSVRGCTDIVAIERKSLADLVGCVGRDRDRFEEELRRLEAYPIRVLVIEASVLDVESHAYRSQVKPQSVLGSCVSWQIDHGIPVLWAGNAQLAARMVEKMLVRVHRANVHAAEIVPLRRLSRATAEDGPNAA